MTLLGHGTIPWPGGFFALCGPEAIGVPTNAQTSECLRAPRVWREVIDVDDPTVEGISQRQIR